MEPGDTVYIIAGIYRETIRPKTSGTAGNYINYTNYNGETVTITNVYDGVDLRGRCYVIVDGLRIVNVSHCWVNMREGGGASHNIIRKCYMEAADGWAGIWMEDTEYIQILNNNLRGTCDGVNGGPGDGIACYSSHYNLIEGNDIAYATHIALSLRKQDATASHHVVRNNTIRNPWHTCMELYGDVDNCLIEGNTILDAGDDYQNNWCGSERDRTQFPRADHRSIQLASSNCIIRKNVMANNGVFIFVEFEGFTCANNRIYNNTSYADYKGVRIYSGNGSVLKNNIYAKNIDYGALGKDNNTLINNNAYECLISGRTTSDNINVNPRFVDENNRVFYLKTSSPMIDAGAFLTTTNRGGSGRNIPVQDVSYFTDGWGIIEGDLIQLEGQTQTLRVVSIDGNIITVDQSISWNNGDGVSLAYSGSAPDIGAFESGFTSLEPLEPPANLHVVR